MNFAFRKAYFDTVATANDRVIGATHGISVMLPTASSVRSGFVLTIKDISGIAAGSNIQIDRAGSDMIDGGNTLLLINSNYAAVSLFSNGVDAWYII